MASSSRVFEKASHAVLYTKFRPTYPKELVDRLLEYTSRFGAGSKLAVDVACGSGQSTLHLMDHFSQCIGIDISNEQIKQAQEKYGSRDNVSFMVGDALSLPLETGTVDLITVAQAWHWLPDVDQFYSECARVLSPKGCLAVYGYGNVCLKDEACNALLKTFYADTLKGYWNSRRSHIDDEYSSVVLPFINTERHDLVMTKETTLTDFIGYVSSWSGYEDYCELNPKNAVLKVLEIKMTESLGCATGNEIHVGMDFPLFLNLGQKKSS